MSTSNVGAPNIYEDGDQKTVKQSEIDQAKKDARFHEGKGGSHKADDPKDERSIANRLAREEKRQNESDEPSLEQKQREKDATLPAKSHGNEPSKGAKVDQQIADEEAEILKKKGAFGPNTSN